MNQNKLLFTATDLKFLPEIQSRLINASLITAEMVLQQCDTEISLGNFTVQVLDNLIEQYIIGKNTLELPEDEFVQVLGVAFGYLVNREFGTEWNIVQDELGTDLACRGRLLTTVYPVATVARSVREKKKGYLALVISMLKFQMLKPSVASS